MILTTLALGVLLSDVTVLRRAHSHNDYLHPRPLLDALERGFCSVEADIHLVGNELLVAHDREEVKKGQTLERLYLDPLAKRLSRNRGVIYPGSRVRFTLLVDIKGDGEKVYPILKRKLAGYSRILTRWRKGVREGGPVMIVLSGDRPIDTVRRDPIRMVAIDGRLEDLEKADFDPTLMPLVSDSWLNAFSWLGPTPLPADKEEALRRWTNMAKEKKAKLRFWSAPDNPEIWSQQLLNGVSVIGTDRLDNFADFMRQASATLVDPPG